ncbi:MAG TPA: serine protease [Thiotrichaceae bacterium]|nr:serine protease [Thiotrichaceae bacterium]
MKYNNKQTGLHTIAFILLFAFSSWSEAKMDASYHWSGATVYSMLDNMGSGVPVSKCHILTNEHVVRGSPQISVYINHKHYLGYVAAIDHDNDMALIKLLGCPLRKFAKLAPYPPAKGEILTSVYYKPGINVFDKVTRTQGEFVGFERIITEEDKAMYSMVINDPIPQKRASGGGIVSNLGLVSVIFGIAPLQEKPTTYAVSYFALREFLLSNRL